MCDEIIIVIELSSFSQAMDGTHNGSLEEGLAVFELGLLVLLV